MPDEQAGTVDAEALETDALSAWVAERRTAALDEAKAREEEALKRWVGDRVAEPELESLDPARKASKPSTSKRPSQTRKAKNRKPRKARQKVAVLASEARAQQNTVGSEPAAELEIPSGVDIEIPMSPSPEVVGASQSGWALSSRQARLAFAWYTSALRQKAAPAARGLAHVLARVAQVGLRATLRGLRQLGLTLAVRLRSSGRSLVRAMRISGRTILRALALAGKPPIRFVSQLDVFGRVGLVLAVSGVAAALALSLSR